MLCMMLLYDLLELRARSWVGCSFPPVFFLQRTSSHMGPSLVRSPPKQRASPTTTTGFFKTWAKGNGKNCKKDGQWPSPNLGFVKDFTKEKPTKCSCSVGGALCTQSARRYGPVVQHEPVGGLVEAFGQYRPPYTPRHTLLLSVTLPPPGHDDTSAAIGSGPWRWP